jgi:hypothetical protein
MRRLSFGLTLCAILLIAGIALGRIGGGDIKYPVKRVGEVTFSHDTHVEAMGFNCTECHHYLCNHGTAQAGQNDPPAAVSFLRVMSQRQTGF